MQHVTGMDLKIERVKARVTAVRLAQEMRVTRQRIAAIEGGAVVTTDTAERYRTALVSLTSVPQMPVEASA